MSSITEDATTAQSALICVETPVDQAGHPSALPRLFGKPVVFHQIKQLERLGVVDFVIAVDSVPAELPEIAELFSKGPTRVRIVRQGADLSQEQMFQGRFLLIAPDIWIGDELAALALKWRGNSIGIVAEDPATTNFERIDLNRRWSGLAVLDANAIAHCAKMPEGWSMASFLLRHALQSGAQEVKIDQSNVLRAKLHKIAVKDDLTHIEVQFTKADGEIGYAENSLGKLIAPVMPTLTNIPWLSNAILWAPLSIAFGSVIAAYFGYASTALILLGCSLTLGVVRLRIRYLEYRQSTQDYTLIFTYLTIISAIWLVLRTCGVEPFEAVFLVLLAAALLLLGRLATDSLVQKIISPLNIGLGLLFIWAIFPFVTGLKILVLGLNGLLLFGAFRGHRKMQS